MKKMILYYLDFKIFCSTILIKTAWFGHKNKRRLADKNKEPRGEFLSVTSDL